jgi:hypothetical protein
MQWAELYNASAQPDGSYLCERGDTYWYNKKGILHREDGPAVIWHDGRVCWYLNNREHTFNEYLKLTPITKETKLLLRLQYS